MKARANLQTFWRDARNDRMSDRRRARQGGLGFMKSPWSMADERQDVTFPTRCPRHVTRRTQTDFIKFLAIIIQGFAGRSRQLRSQVILVK